MNECRIAWRPGGKEEEQRLPIDTHDVALAWWRGSVSASLASFMVEGLTPALMGWELGSWIVREMKEQREI
jgi:hypothetical protein